jgi:hypothetical protein
MDIEPCRAMNCKTRLLYPARAASEEEQDPSLKRSYENQFELD